MLSLNKLVVSSFRESRAERNFKVRFCNPYQNKQFRGLEEERVFLFALTPLEASNVLTPILFWQYLCSNKDLCGTILVLLRTLKHVAAIFLPPNS